MKVYGLCLLEFKRELVCVSTFLYMCRDEWLKITVQQQLTLKPCSTMSGSFFFLIDKNNVIYLFKLIEYIIQHF